MIMAKTPIRFVSKSDAYKLYINYCRWLDVLEIYFGWSCFHIVHLPNRVCRWEFPESCYFRKLLSPTAPVLSSVGIRAPGTSNLTHLGCSKDAVSGKGILYIIRTLADPNQSGDQLNNSRESRNLQVLLATWVPWMPLCNSQCYCYQNTRVWLLYDLVEESS